MALRYALMLEGSLAANAVEVRSAAAAAAGAEKARIKAISRKPLRRLSNRCALCVYSFIKTRSKAGGSVYGLQDFRGDPVVVPVGGGGVRGHATGNAEKAPRSQTRTQQNKQNKAKKQKSKHPGLGCDREGRDGRQQGGGE